MNDLKELNPRFLPTDRNISHRDLSKTIIKIVQDENFDLIHSHGFTSAICSIIGALITKTPHVLTCHDVFTPKTSFMG